MFCALATFDRSIGWIRFAIDIAREGGRVEGDDIEVGALGALHLGEHLVDRAGVDDVDVGTRCGLELVDPVGLGIAFPGQDAEFVGGGPDDCRCADAGGGRRAAAVPFRK